MGCDYWELLLGELMLVVEFEYILWGLSGLGNTVACYGIFQK